MVEFGFRYFGRILIRVSRSNVDQGILVGSGSSISVGSGSEYRIQVFWSDQDPGISVGSESEYIGRIRILVFWWDPDPGNLAGS